MVILFFILLPGLVVVLVEGIRRRNERTYLAPWLAAAPLLVLLPTAFPRSLGFARVAASVLFVGAVLQIFWRRRR